MKRYCEQKRRNIVGQVFQQIQVINNFLLLINLGHLCHFFSSNYTLIKKHDDLFGICLSVFETNNAKMPLQIFLLRRKSGTINIVTIS